MKLQAEMVKNKAIGIRCISAASIATGMKPSETMQVTGGALEDAESLSLSSSSLNGANKFFMAASKRAATSCVAFSFEGGRPSGMDSNRKSGKPFMASGPLDLSKRR
ncbi:hypothetical protein OIU79_013362 [Salix purpurea]|uniref:Uncharacterized protein n=1 Tax=Salix purpurea TaxID=77065 RepID=A0A9Q0Q593_SALPP|nr:hypothetical protein OIU79_013362 [Salix purpurea]